MASVLSQLMVGLPGTEVPSYLRELAQRGLRSVCIYGENVESEEQLRQYVANLRSVLGPEAIIAIDEEGGEVTRVDYRTGSKFAGNGFLGRLGNLELTARDGRLIAQKLRSIGINLNLAPVADVNLEPANPVIGIRSFGSDQELVAEHVASFVQAHERAGVRTTLKHFPGHGNTRIDSHHDLPKVEGGLAELVATQMEPFKAGIAAGASAVMLGHLDLGLSAPSSMSSEVVNYLRQDLGFSGIIITDAIDMGALGAREELPRNAIRALLAGVDLVCLGPRTEVSELEEILELANELGLNESKGLADSLSRMTVFQDNDSIAVSDYADAIYPPGAFSFETQPPANVLRFKSQANFAVGEVPWFVGVEAETIEDPSLLEARIAELDGQTAVLFRTALSAQEVVVGLSDAARARLLAVVPEPPSENMPCQYLVTYGSAIPQSDILLKFLSEGHNSDDD